MVRRIDAGARLDRSDQLPFAALICKNGVGVEDGDKFAWPAKRPYTRHAIYLAARDAPRTLKRNG